MQGLWVRSKKDIPEYRKDIHEMLKAIVINLEGDLDLLGKKIETEYQKQCDLYYLNHPAVGQQMINFESLTTSVWDGKQWIVIGSMK